jgi:hypothetical protein
MAANLSIDDTYVQFFFSLEKGSFKDSLEILMLLEFFKNSDIQVKPIKGKCNTLSCMILRTGSDSQKGFRGK